MPGGQEDAAGPVKVRFAQTAAERKSQEVGPGTGKQVLPEFRWHIRNAGRSGFICRA